MTTYHVSGIESVTLFQQQNTEVLLIGDVAERPEQVSENLSFAKFLTTLHDHKGGFGSIHWLCGRPNIVPSSTSSSPLNMFLSLEEEERLFLYPSFCFHQIPTVSKTLKHRWDLHVAMQAIVSTTVNDRNSACQKLLALVRAFHELPITVATCMDDLWKMSHIRNLLAHLESLEDQVIQKSLKTCLLDDELLQMKEFQVVFQTSDTKQHVPNKVLVDWNATEMEKRLVSMMSTKHVENEMWNGLCHAIANVGRFFFRLEGHCMWLQILILRAQGIGRIVVSVDESYHGLLSHLLRSSYFDQLWTSKRGNETSQQYVSCDRQWLDRFRMMSLLVKGILSGSNPSN